MVFELLFFFLLRDSATQELVKTTQLFLILTMCKVKLHTKCSRDLKSRSLRDQRILVLRCSYQNIVECNLVCNHSRDYQNRSAAKREPDLLIKRMITDRIGRHEVLLSIDHKYYTFRGCYKKQKVGEKFGKFSIS